MKQKSKYFSKRVLSFFIVGVSVAVIPFFLRNSIWIGNEKLHLAFNVILIILGLLIAMISLIRFYSKKSNTFLFIAVGFLGAALFDIYHVIAESTYFIAVFSEPTYNFSVWSWNAGRVFLGLFLLLSYYAYLKEKKQGISGRFKESSVYLMGVILGMILFLLFSYFSLPQFYWSFSVFSRPEELLPGVLFLFAAVGYLKKGYWRTYNFEYWLVISLIISTMLHFTVMIFSWRLFDAYFDLAYILKIISYIAVLCGLLNNIYNVFQEVEQSRKILRRHNHELEHAEKTAKNNERKIFSIVDSIGDGVFVVGKDKKVTLFSRTAKDITGYDFGEAVGSSYEKLLKFKFNNGKKNDDFVNRCLKTCKTVEMKNDTILTIKDNKQIEVGGKAAPIYDYNDKLQGCVVVFRDVSMQRKINKMKTEFVSVASHQLKTPLTAIRWGVEMLNERDGKNLTKEERERIDDIQSSVDRMIELVNSLLNVSRLETARLKIVPKKTSMEKLIEKVVEEMKPIAKAKNCTVKFVKPNKKFPLVNLDQQLFYQVVHNLVNNAVKYTVGSKKNVQITAAKDKKSYIITVKDNGIGIPKDVQEKIFSKFFRANNAMSAAPGGSGLGLYIVKMILKESGGKIWFESKEGKGTSFFVSLPLTGMKKKAGEKSLA